MHSSFSKAGTKLFQILILFEFIDNSTAQNIYFQAGYQITQQRSPLAQDGILEFSVFTPGIHKSPYTKEVRIKQLQLEQDSGKSLHDTDRSLIDLNRAGMGLMEVVFEPDLNDGEEAAALVKELIAILGRIETCSCKMEGIFLLLSEELKIIGSSNLILSTIIGIQNFFN